MAESTLNQQALLRGVKEALGLEWNDLADQAGIHRRALANYILPDTSKGHRKMPELAVRSVIRMAKDSGMDVSELERQALNLNGAK